MNHIPTAEGHRAHVAADGHAAYVVKHVAIPLASLQIEICEKCAFVTTTCLHNYCTWRYADGSPLQTLSGQLTGRESGEQEIEDDSHTSLICDFCGLDCT